MPESRDVLNAQLRVDRSVFDKAAKDLKSGVTRQRGEIDKLEKRVADLKRRAQALRAEIRAANAGATSGGGLSAAGGQIGNALKGTIGGFVASGVISEVINSAGLQESQGGAFLSNVGQAAAVGALGGGVVGAVAGASVGALGAVWGQITKFERDIEQIREKQRRTDEINKAARERIEEVNQALEAKFAQRLSNALAAQDKESKELARMTWELTGNAN